MPLDLNKDQILIYNALIHAVKTNSGIGFRNKDQGHPAYKIHPDGSTLKDMGDSPDHNDLYKILRSLTEELGECAHPPVRSWLDFCRLASNDYEEARELE